MEGNLEKFLNKAKNIKLSDGEKDAMRSHLYAYMWQNPMRLKEKSQVSIFALHWRVTFAVLALFIVTGSGASYAASKSLPGDTLYSMKVGVNEEVKTFFAFTDLAKAEVNANLAEVRLEEAEKLAEAGKLDMETRVKLETEFKKKADKFEEGLKKIEEKNKKANVNKKDITKEDEVEDLGAEQNILKAMSAVNEETKVDENTENSENQTLLENTKDSGAVEESVNPDEDAGDNRGENEDAKEENKKRSKSEKLKAKFEERMRARTEALEKIKQSKFEKDGEDDEDEIEPLLKEVRGRIKSDWRD